MTFGDLLRQRRQAARLTQEELAATSGISARTISDLERGRAKKPQAETIRRLAAGLSLSESVLPSFQLAARSGAELSRHATRNIPPDVAAFTGREDELARITATIRQGGVLGVYAIDGMPGVGKTTLAVRAAHDHAGWFPDGQIFLQLDGHNPGREPLDPADALTSLLAATGIGASEVPESIGERTDLWRDRTADRRLLLVLDDAVDAGQVLPLLPSGRSSLVLITSRRRLGNLTDAHSISVGTLPASQAAQLFVRLADRDDVRPADLAVGAITQLCGGLPLAIGIAARQLRFHPAWTAADLAEDLQAARDEHELLSADNLPVASAFALSYSGLSEHHQEMFRRLALHPGSDIEPFAAGALAGVELAVARRQLKFLYTRNLLLEPSRGRYRFHDLIREYAQSLVADDPASDRDRTLGRLFDYYAKTAEQAERQLDYRPAGFPVLKRREQDAVAQPRLRDRFLAQTWVRDERENLTACLGFADRAGDDIQTLELTAALAPVLRSDGPFSAAVSRHPGLFTPFGRSAAQ